MRTHGTLAKWNDDRGFGFIAPAQGSAEIFVHISAFPRDGERPRLNELISFETEVGDNGKLRAVRVMRPGRSTAPRRVRDAGRTRPSKGPAGALVGLLVLAAVGAYGYSRIKDRDVTPVATSQLPVAPVSPANSFQCDGRTMCSQMRSCAEATYFLQHCPNTEMDGNHDGEPCEQQWCN